MRKLLLASVATLGATLVMAGAAKAQPAKPVAPGTIAVHLNGYLEFEFGAYGSNLDTVNSGGGAYKLNSVSTNGDVRLYPGFDAATENGVEYGAQVETRVTTSNAGKAVGSNSTSSGGTSSVYIRRAYGYIGTPEAGFVRFGQTDSVFSLDQAGVVEKYGDGGQFNQDGGPQQMLPGNAAPGQFIYADQGALYATDKIVYLTPEIAGFSGGIGYEPNSNGLKEGYANCSSAASTCAALIASPTAGDIGTRRRNTIDAMLQYSTTADGVKYKISGGYLHGAPIAYNGPAASAPTPYGYDDLSVYQVGAEATFGGLTLGANLKSGAVEDGYAFKPKGARNGFAYILGADYVMGPWVFGVSYFNNQTSGSYIPGKSGTAPTLSEYGLGVGGNYVIAKPMSLFVQYLYGHRHQPGNTKLSASGNAQVNLISAGAIIKW